jgi:hypothetical protein
VIHTNADAGLCRINSRPSKVDVLPRCVQARTLPARAALANARSLTIPIVEGRRESSTMTERSLGGIFAWSRACVDGNLVGVWVLDNFGRDHGADSEVAKRTIGIVDDLMRSRCTAWRRGNHVALTNRKLLVTHAQETASFDDEEHLLVHMMTMKRICTLSWRDDDERVAEQSSAHRRAQRCILGFEFFAVLMMFERCLVEVDDRFHARKAK